MENVYVPFQDTECVKSFAHLYSGFWEGNRLVMAVGGNRGGSATKQKNKAPTTPKSDEGRCVSVGRIRKGDTQR